MSSKTIPPWIAAALSKEQLKPFSRNTRNACILAGAGSGKTQTLVHLIANDLATGIPASNIIAFTFTEKAASELFARIHSVASKNIPQVDLSGIFVGTIHSWCFNYLLKKKDFYNFEPIDELHLDALASRLYDYLNLKSVYQKEFPKGVDNFLADLEIFYNENLLLDQVPQNVRPLIQNFQDILKNNRLMTFGGMIRNTVDYLVQNGPINDLVSLYVDEYQDVNPAQVILIKSMVSDKGKIVVVGDELQCIYNWRGSDVNRILNFNKDFHRSETYRLSSNYRSRPGIVKISNRIADGISLRDVDKVMIPKRNEFPSKVVHWFSVDNDENQAQLVKQIVKSFAAEGVPYNRIAILLRSVVSWGQIFVNALLNEGIPVNCPILGRGGGFIKTFLLPCINWLLIDQVAPKNEIDEQEQELRNDDLWQSAQAWGVKLEKEKTFWEELNRWYDLIQQNHSSAYDVRGRLYDFLNECGIHVNSNDNDLMVGLGIASQILRSVEEIQRRRIRGHTRRSAMGVLKDIFFAMIRNQQRFGESIPIDTSVDAVLLTTVHQAKGLEWPVVILPMLMQGRFPVRSSRHGTSFPDKIADRYGTSLEDEKRLFYVAFTRAKERLFLIDAAENASRRRSIFLNELKQGNVFKKSNIDHLNTQVWVIDKKDLEEADPAPVDIGLSDILMFLECPYQYALRRLASIQPSIGDDLGFGKGLHELIQRRIVEGLSWSINEIQENANIYVNLPYTSAEQEAVSRKAIVLRLHNLEKLGVFSVKVKPEVSVDVALRKGIIRGVIDGILINDDKSVLIRDWKSTLHDQFIPRYERQLQFYAYALQLKECIIQKADIVDVKASDDAKKLVTKVIPVEPKQIKLLLRDLDDALESISNRVFPITNDPACCQFCDMLRICGERIEK